MFCYSSFYDVGFWYENIVFPRFWVRGFEMSHYICEWGGAVGEDSIHRFMRGGGVKGFQPQ